MAKTILRFTDVGACVILLALAAWRGPHTRAWYAGLALALATLPLWVAARRQLGGFLPTSN